MKIGLILQARMTSKRLPGKMMKRVGGKTILQHVYDRVKATSKSFPVIIATSTDPTDDLIANYCKQNEIQVHRGALKNVAQRFLSVLEHYRLEAFVRINGDSPLIDSKLIDAAVDLFLEGNYDLVSNVQERTYPRGQSVEVIRSDVFKQAYPSFQGDDFEHVTSYFYRSSDQFHIYCLKASEDYSAINFCVDTEEDLKRFDEILKEVGPAKQPSWQCLVTHYQKINNSHRIAIHEN